MNADNYKDMLKRYLEIEREEARKFMTSDHRETELRARGKVSFINEMLRKMGKGELFD